MRKLILTFGALSFLIPSWSFAQGLNCLGFVSVSEAGEPVTTSISGTMNVRWNAVQQTNVGEFILLSGSGGIVSPVVINARDGNDVTGFCIVSATSQYYAMTRALLAGGGDGTIISASKTAPSSECTFVNVQKHSCFQE